MKQKLTLSISSRSLKFAKKYAREKKLSVSEITDRYFDTLRKIEAAGAASKDTFTEKFAGIFNTGSKDIIKELFGT